MAEKYRKRKSKEEEKKLKARILAMYLSGKRIFDAKKDQLFDNFRNIGGQL